MNPSQVLLPSQQRTPDAASQRAMAIGMAISAAVHLSLLIGMSFWKGREQPPVIYTVTLVSPSTAALPPSAVTKPQVSRPVRPAPPPPVTAPAQDAPDSLQAWWEKQAKSLKKKQTQQAKLTPPMPLSKIDKPSTNPIQNAAGSTPVAAATPAQATPAADATTNAILQTGIPGADQALLTYPSYFSRVQNKIDRQWVATRSRVGGASAVVLFRIQKNGMIQAVQMEQPSGDWIFDQAALRAVQEASPLPPLPPGLTTQVVHYRFVSQVDKRP